MQGKSSRLRGGLTVVVLAIASCGLMSRMISYQEQCSLLTAVAGNDTTTALYLINRGVNPNCRRPLEPFPSSLSSVRRYVSRLEWSNHGTTVLMLAAARGNTTLVRALIARGANVNARALCGYTALRWANQAGKKDVEALLKTAGGETIQLIRPACAGACARTYSGMVRQNARFT